MLSFSQRRLQWFVCQPTVFLREREICSLSRFSFALYPLLSSALCWFTCDFTMHVVVCYAFVYGVYGLPCDFLLVYLRVTCLRLYKISFMARALSLLTLFLFVYSMNMNDNRFQYMNPTIHFSPQTKCLILFEIVETILHLNAPFHIHIIRMDLVVFI